MIIQLIILLILTFFFLILLAYVHTYKDYLIQKYNAYMKNKEEKSNQNFNNKKGILNTIKHYFTNDYIIYSKPKSNNEKTFTVLSYNILSQKYLHKTVKENIFLEKKIRLDNIVSEIKQINPEIFCLQEAMDDIIKSHIKKYFEKDYKIIHYDNEGSSLKNVIGIKKERFEILNESRVIICDDKLKNILNNQNNNENNENDDEENYDFYENKIHVTGNRGIINVCIKDKLVKNKIINLFCVHFPWRPIFEYQKARIMGLIFDLILRKKIPNVIIAGDFNSVPNSIVLKMVYYQDWEAEMTQNKEYIGNFIHNKKEKDLIQETLDKMDKRENFEKMINYLMKLSKEIWDGYKLRSAYDSYRNEVRSENFGFLRNHPKYTNYTNKFIDTIDYIFYSKSLINLKILKIPDVEKDRSDKKENLFLPNDKYPSDHLKLVANFEYKY